MVAGINRREAVIVTRCIAYEGGGPFLRALVVALEQQGLTVVVRRDGLHVDQHRESREMGGNVTATLVATGPGEAIDAGVGTFQRRFGQCAQVRVEGESTPPPTQGRHRA